MAKKTTVKSTSKKKTAAKKKKTTAKVQTTAKKTMNAGAKQEVGKNSAGKTATTPKKTTVKQKKTSLKDLLMKKFDRWQPKDLYVAPADAAYQAGFSAPPRFDENDARSREVLSRKFDFDLAAVSKPPKKKLTVAELLKLKFDRWHPKDLYVAPSDAAYQAGFSAVPRFDKNDARSREVLNRRFDFDLAAVSKPPKKKLTVAELLNLKFDRWQPKDLYVAPADAVYQAGFSASPRFAENDARSRKVLNRRFDFDLAAVSKPPKKKLTVAELLNLKFDRWQPKDLYVAPVDAAYQAGFSASPRFAENDARSREILSRKFDFDFAELAAKAEAERKAAEAKAAAEKAEAERKAAEAKAAAEKAEAERKAAEAKAAAEKAEAERKAAEAKAAAEKAEAERKAAEAKAAAEKAEAERKAAEAKAAAEKAEAERKAAEAKAAAEKAEAERKAAEAKAAAEKAEAERKAAEAAALAKKKADPVERAIRYTVACLAVIFTLIVAASFTNYTKYYLKSNGDVVEVWKGRFSPIGEVQIAELPGSAMPSTKKDIYTKAEALTMAFGYFISKADDLLAEDVPDLQQIQSHLSRAGAFAFNDEYKNAVDTRLAGVNLMLLLYRADAAAAKGGPADLEKALKYLEEAAALKLTEPQALIVEKRAEAIQGILQAAEEPEAIAPENAAPEAAGEPAAAPEENPAEKAPEPEKVETTL